MIMERVSTNADEGLFAHMWGPTGGTPSFAQYEDQILMTEQTQLSVFDDVKRLEQRLEEIMIQMRALATRRDEEVPEVFELQPSEVRHVMARVQSSEQARFYFVGDDDDEDLEP